MPLSRLKIVSLREGWKHEAADFTKWLAQDENLQLLGEEIGVDISVLQTEASVGSFSVDILAEEKNEGRKIIIENQLETTNHDHLGKLITYASGFNAEVIIWIVKNVRDEHKQAIDWLNEHTDDRINIFIIRMELWQIGDSPYAPKFHIVSQPNNWAKTIKGWSANSQLTDRRLMQFTFWEQFKEFASEQKSTLRLRKPYAQQWYDISIGNSKCHLSFLVDADNEQIRCELYIPDSKPLFKELYAKKDQIETMLSQYELEWMELEGRKASRIKATFEIDIENRDNWVKCFQWLIKSGQDFQKAFSSILKKIKAGN